MKKPRIANALNQVDDDIVISAARAKKVKKNNWIKWGAIVACFAVMLATFLTVTPMLFKNASPSVPTEEIPSDEYQYESRYFYQINEGAYSNYIGGKVITEDKIGNKIAEVNLTAGWKDGKGEWKSEPEALRGEVYVIKGIADDVAVGLKFIDQGEAVTTTHYYVIMNPAADLSEVKDYVITPTNNTPSDGIINE
ncbi:MAG: hypothetical protein E7607_01760 [Ruminococcaceae bacterium]|nr:hypothetical protein [Oscillospiraceae bacterium]